MSAETHAQRRECFVLGPIGKEASDGFYEYFLRPVVEENGFCCVRADEIRSAGSLIIQEIYSHITNSAVVLADITGQNPNVLYEVGYAHAKGRLVILLVQSEQDIPSDLKGHRFVLCDVNSPRGYHQAKEAIKSNLISLRPKLSYS